jgi:hypothetical protein
MIGENAFDAHRRFGEGDVVHEVVEGALLRWLIHWQDGISR